MSLPSYESDHEQGLHSGAPCSSCSLCVMGRNLVTESVGGWRVATRKTRAGADRVVARREAVAR